jgi:rhodanese-related sulfurtransferase
MTATIFAQAADPAAAARHFADRLAFETDVSDVHAALHADDPGFVLVDARGRASFEQGHLPGALHLPQALIPDLAATLIPAGTPVVVYCWGPGCNGAQKAALNLARLGYPVKEMLGGYEYWVREGFAVVTAQGEHRGPVDPLTAPTGGPTCEC